MMVKDLIGIGIGPFNLGLAALLSSHSKVSASFFERKKKFEWHSGLLLPGTTLQVPFFADLVSMADPTHPLSFLNYLHEHDRLYHFYFYEKFLIPRLEYDHYCRWASQKLQSCNFGQAIQDVRYDHGAGNFVVTGVSDYGLSKEYRSRDLSVGIGTSPIVPEWAVKGGSRVFHTSEFKHRLADLEKCKRVVVVGSGQSAAEAVLTLYQAMTPEQAAKGASITWVSRSAGFFPMEYSKLGLEYFTPDYMTHFHRMDREKRRDIVRSQGLLYKGISAQTIADIFDLLYERTMGGRPAALSMMTNCSVDGLENTAGSSGLGISISHNNTHEHHTINADAMILGTGYAHAWPEWFDNLKNKTIVTDDEGHAVVGEDFTAQRQDGGDGRIFIQNAEVFQHGVGAPDLGLAPYRNAMIANQILGCDHYKTPRNSAFQSFDFSRLHEEKQSITRALTSA